MSRADSIIPYIYHEKQETGSMLCAQHALNALVQAPHFTAPDLAAIAQGLDHLEAEHMTSPDPSASARSPSSANFDETGFFSVQVMEEACRSVNLQLVRWRSKEMACYHDYPEKQNAFILNHQLHWYTLRRFGSSPHHFFNLDSTISQPEWVSPTLLGMTLHQAEREGYSIFTIVSPSNEDLFPCDADQVARHLGDGDYINGYGYSSPHYKKRRTSDFDADGNHEDDVKADGMYELGKKQKWESSEDEELRRAIAASLLTDAASSDLLSQSQYDSTSTSASSTFVSETAPSKADKTTGRDLHNEIYNFSSTVEAPHFYKASTKTKENSVVEDADDSIALAIAASLERESSQTPSIVATDEPNLDEMRRRRLARFG